MMTPEIRKEINELAHKNGWWDKFELHKKLLLIISEVTEAMEADRINKYCLIKEDGKKEMLSQSYNDYSFTDRFDRLIKHTFQDEIADIIIRTSDLAFEMDIDIETYIKLKHKYNIINGKDKSKKY